MPLISVGKPAPPFTLRNQSGRASSLGDFRGKAVVLYFYPKDDTTACTAQACAFMDALPGFRKMKAVVLGISPDDRDSHRAFADKFGLRFPLLADAERDEKDRPIVCHRFGVWGEKSMYGRTYLGVVRTTYLIDREGIVRRRWDKVKVKGHADEVLEAVGGLSEPGAG